jgi:poly-gamma-glutamate synthesis protein (capsule biosynthesis protein)
MLCGDILHTAKQMEYAKGPSASFNYRLWFRNIKPLFFFSDFVIANLRTSFAGEPYDNIYNYSAPSDFLGELSYSGFNVLMLANKQNIHSERYFTEKSINKIDLMGFYKVGNYMSPNEKKTNYPLVLEKKDIRIAFLNYSVDTSKLDPSDRSFNKFILDSVTKDILQAKKMLADFIVLYMDNGSNTENKMALYANLFSLGVHVIVGTSSNNGFTTADVLTYSGGEKKILVDNIGAINADVNTRETNKTAVIEIILRRNKLSKQTTMHDMGFIPIWTLMDPNRYSVLPISNIEEGYVKNIGLNFMQYSKMKMALTDLRYHFYDKIPEIHYDFNDTIVSNVEQTAFIRKTVLKEQGKINEQIADKGISEYLSLFDQLPPENKYVTPYIDALNVYSGRKNTFLLRPVAPKTNQNSQEFKSMLGSSSPESIDESKYLSYIAKYEADAFAEQAELNIQYKKNLEDIEHKYQSFVQDLNKDLKDKIINQNDYDRFQTEYSNNKSTKLIEEQRSFEQKKNDIQARSFQNIYNMMGKSISLQVGEIDLDQQHMIINEFKKFAKNSQSKELTERGIQDILDIKKEQSNESSAQNIYRIQANQNVYSRIRDTVKPLTREQLMKLDSIKKYNARFIVEDTFAILKQKLRQRRLDSLKQRDSIIKSQIDPNYISKVETLIEKQNTYTPSYVGQKTGVFTSSLPPTGKDEEVMQSDQSPIKEIEEFFYVQVYSLSKYKEIDLEKYPYLSGYEVKVDAGFYRYLVGKTRTPQLAIEICKDLRSRGLNDAIVIRYNNGVRSIYKSTF